MARTSELLTRRTVIIVWSFVAIAFVAGVLVLNPLYGEICQGQVNSNNKNCDTYHIAIVVGWHTGRFFDAAAAPISALATIAIAVFTWTLWRTSSRQAEITDKAVSVAQAANDLNRENAITSRRAWLSIEDVKLIYPTMFTEDLMRFVVSATIKNHGMTPATRRRGQRH